VFFQALRVVTNQVCLGRTSVCILDAHEMIPHVVLATFISLSTKVGSIANLPADGMQSTTFFHTLCQVHSLRGCWVKTNHIGTKCIAATPLNITFPGVSVLCLIIGHPLADWISSSSLTTVSTVILSLG